MFWVKHVDSNLLINLKTVDHQRGCHKLLESANIHRGVYLICVAHPFGDEQTKKNRQIVAAFDSFNLIILNLKSFASFDYALESKV